MKLQLVFLFCQRNISAWNERYNGCNWFREDDVSTLDCLVISHEQQSK